MIHYIKLELTIEEKAQKQLVENEAQKSQVGTYSMENEQTDDHGKDVTEYPQHLETSSTFDVLLKSA